MAGSNLRRVTVGAVGFLLFFLYIVAFNPHWITSSSPSSSSAGVSTSAAPDGRVDQPPKVQVRRPVKSNDIPATDSPLDAFYLSGPVINCPKTSFSKAELESAKGGASLLILIHGKVLNVTSFLSQHPGGSALRVAEGGVDGAEVFAQYHQPSTIGLWSNFCVGVLA